VQKINVYEANAPFDFRFLYYISIFFESCGQNLTHIQIKIEGVVHFKIKTFADNLLTPMSSKISMSIFLQLKRN